jgi:DNA helicase II / ATP-dependent DNA helicase PcrA
MKTPDPPKWDEGLEGACLRIAALEYTPLRVMAGPGTGKTFAVMKRVARLLQEGVDPKKILVCTFTRTAAKDLSNELKCLGIVDAENIKAGTLHSLCFKILTDEEVFAHTGRHVRPVLAFEERFLIEDMVNSIFGGTRDCTKRLKAFDAAWARLQSDIPGWPVNETDQAFHLKLQKWLNFHECILIGELVPETLQFLRNNPYSPYLNRYEHVLVDEYQDLNKAEQEMIDLLSANGNLTIIGDVNQSIYSFRHAHPQGVSDFHLAHQGTHDEELIYCRRCPARVVDMANSLIKNNRIRSNRELKYFNDNPDGEAYVVQWQNMEEEAKGIARFVSEYINTQKVDPGRIIVLSTRRCFGTAIRASLTNARISSHSFFHEELLDGNPKKEEDSLTQEAFCLLTLLANIKDIVALRCWCGFGSNSLNKNGWSRLMVYCANNGIDPWSALANIAEGKLSIPYTRPLLDKFHFLLREIDKLKYVKGQDLVDALFPIGHEYNFRIHQIASQIETEDFDANTLRNALITAITQPELPTDVDYVRVMSLHKSKGLTADLVIIAGCIEGLLPCISGDTLEEEERIIEEQRRLLYVAITRAKKTVLLSGVSELPRDLAHRIRAKIRGGNAYIGNTLTSRFLAQLGDYRPNTIKGHDLFGDVSRVGSKV